LAFVDVMAITFLFYETDESAIKMITLLLLVDFCMSLVAHSAEFKCDGCF
jgi:hypothetical protein